MDREFKVMVIHNPKIDPHTYLGSFLGIHLHLNGLIYSAISSLLYPGILGFMPCLCACVAQADLQYSFVLQVILHY